jgi:hypothetical protein
MSYKLSATSMGPELIDLMTQHRALMKNFMNPQLEWKRVLRSRETNEHNTADLHV